MSRDDVKFLADQLGDLTALVRGHIEKSHEHMDIVNKHMEKSDKHIEEDMKWKEKMQPIFDKIPELTTVGETVETAKSIKKGVTWWAGFFAAITVIFGSGAYVFKTLLSLILK